MAVHETARTGIVRSAVRGFTHVSYRFCHYFSGGAAVPLGEGWVFVDLVYGFCSLMILDARILLVRIGKHIFGDVETIVVAVHGRRRVSYAGDYRWMAKPVSSSLRGIWGHPNLC